MPIYNDIAIPLAWPDKTAYGDEKWMAWLKKFGVVKNLNFKVGHAGIVLVERQSGKVSYFDFGRYITPRGYGRARSREFDPRLTIYTQAKFTNFGSEISNLEEILQELEEKEDYTHGGGRLLFSLAQRISYPKAFDYAAELVEQGPIPYGALASGNNSCSRYVAQILVKGMDPQDRRIRKIYYPECLKASPTSNVVNAKSDDYIYCYSDRVLEKWPMGRRASLRYQWGLLQDNLSHKRSALLANDDSPVLLVEPTRPFGLPADAQWLGGIGEGMWFCLSGDQETSGYQIEAYCQEGKLIYRSNVRGPDSTFARDKPYRFLAKLSGSYFTIEQNGNEFIFRKLEEQEKIYNQKVY